LVCFSQNTRNCKLSIWSCATGIYSIYQQTSASPQELCHLSAESGGSLQFVGIARAPNATFASSRCAVQG
jgi:hypothetical protein